MKVAEDAQFAAVQRSAREQEPGGGRRKRRAGIPVLARYTGVYI